MRLVSGIIRAECGTECRLAPHLLANAPMHVGMVPNAGYGNHEPFHIYRVGEPVITKPDPPKLRTARKTSPTVCSIGRILGVFAAQGPYDLAWSLARTAGAAFSPLVVTGIMRLQGQKVVLTVNRNDYNLLLRGLLHWFRRFSVLGCMKGYVMESVTVQVPKERLSEFYALLSQFFSKDEAPGSPGSGSITGVASASTPPLGRPVRGRYAPLYHYFKGAKADEVDLTFGDIEGILGAELPASAREHRPVWANSEGSFLGRVWLRAGWRLEKIDMRTEEVRFKRVRS